MKPKCEPLKWKLLNSIFRKYCSPYSTHFNILFTSRGRRPTCVISVPIPAKQTKTRKHKQHNGSSRQIEQASLLSKSYHTIRRAESFNTLQPRQMKLGRIEKVKTGSMFFFFQWHRVLLPFTPFPLHLAKVILAFLKRKEKLFQSS